jgi:hypothetical protein
LAQQPYQHLASVQVPLVLQLIIFKLLVVVVVVHLRAVAVVRVAT